MVLSETKKKKPDLVKLKDNLLNKKTLPPGIVPNAAKLASCDLHEMNMYLEYRYVRTNQQEWKAAVSEHFDEYAKSSTETSSSSASTSHTAPLEEEEQYSVFTVPMHEIIRKDLSPEVHRLIMTKISTSMIRTTDFVVCYSSLIQMIINMFRSYQFVVDGVNNNISFRQTPGFDLKSITPSSTNDLESCFTVQPLDDRLLETASLCNDFSQLFTSQHFGVLFSHFFGSRRVNALHSTTHPVQNALFTSLEEAGNNKQAFTLTMPCAEAMTDALDKFVVNFENMWSAKKTINKLLDKVILVLLRSHVAAARESKRKLNTTQRRPKINQDRKNLKNRSRLVYRREKKKLRKLKKRKREASLSERHKWISRISESERRISALRETFKKKLAQLRESSASAVEEDHENQSDDQEEETLGDDVLRRRIAQLKSVVKHLIFSESKVVSESDLKVELPTATQKEITACITIINCVKKFLPARKNYHITAFQLHFCIFANDVLRYTKYQKFTRSLSPVTSMATINAFHLSASTLFQILTQEHNESTAAEQNEVVSDVRIPTKLIVYGYSKKPIYSIQESRQHKDATFNSFFDMSRITRKCASYKLKFVHRITCLPGLKVARNLGTVIFEQV